jgi:hypothetical protein
LLAVIAACLTGLPRWSNTLIHRGLARRARHSIASTIASVARRRRGGLLSADRPQPGQRASGSAAYRSVRRTIHSPSHRGQ